MSKITRRNAIISSLAAPAMGIATPIGGEIDQSGVGVNIKIAWAHGQWEVLMPDWDNLSSYWKPGMPIMWKWILLTEYLEEMENEFNLRPKA